MCKSWILAYSCTHTHMIRLSKCRGSVTFQQLKLKRKSGTSSDLKVTPSDLKVACCGAASLELSVKHPCGECEREPIEKELKTTIAAFRSSHFMDEKGFEDLADAEYRYDRALHALHKRVPGAQYKKYCRPEKGQRATSLPRTSSLLVQEVKVEDLPDTTEEDDAYYRDWASGWGSSPAQWSCNETSAEEGFVPDGDEATWETLDWTQAATNAESAVKDKSVEKDVHQYGGQSMWETFDWMIAAIEATDAEDDDNSSDEDEGSANKSTQTSTSTTPLTIDTKIAATPAVESQQFQGLKISTTSPSETEPSIKFELTERLEHCNLSYVIALSP